MVREETFFTISRRLKGKLSITNLFLVVHIAQIEKGEGYAPRDVGVDGGSIRGRGHLFNPIDD